MQRKKERKYCEKKSFSLLIGLCCATKAVSVVSLIRGSIVAFLVVVVVVVVVVVLVVVVVVFVVVVAAVVNVFVVFLVYQPGQISGLWFLISIDLDLKITAWSCSLLYASEKKQFLLLSFLCC